MNNCIDQTKQWINRFVIGQNLCPFAAKALELDSIHFYSTNSLEELDILQSFWKVILDINQSDKFNSALYILEQACKDFDAYLNILDKANWLLEDTELNQKYQLASFHPDYIFKDKDKDDVSNYTNRSPYPIIHILSVDEVSKAVASHPNIDDIPIRNISHLESLGLEKIKFLLKNLY
ncbi:MAG: DUF1415 domain-containing protein [Saprospiraceae bacterium]|nr:DUF1415 domain-containing protein [Saprospiraceae bacterium]